MKQQPPAGARLPIIHDPQFTVRIGGRKAERIAVAAVGKSGKVFPFQEISSGQWHLAGLPNGEDIEIVAYIIDDSQGGFVNQSYPIDIEVAGEQFRFPEPGDQLAAVILAEIYSKSGTRRMKVSNEGFAFGIDAYARARNIERAAIPFIKQATPGRPAPWDGPVERYEPRQSSGQMASGSGVYVTPNVIVTNAHVLEDGYRFGLGRTRQDLLPICVDPIHDLALLQSPSTGTPLPIRSGSPIWLGESVLASGYPLMDVLGADLKVSTGNISGLTGSHGDVARFQFTAPIGSGSSGGAIIDEFGNLVGITSASLAHGNMRERGSISENVNFGVRCALVYEMLGAAGIDVPSIALSRDNNRRDVVQRLRNSVVSIAVSM